MAIFQVNLGYPVASFILRSDWCKTFWSQNARTDNDQKKYVLDLSLLHPLTPNGRDIKPFKSDGILKILYGNYPPDNHHNHRSLYDVYWSREVLGNM